MRAWLYSRACPLAHRNAGYCGCCRCSSCAPSCRRASCGLHRQMGWKWCSAAVSLAPHHHKSPIIVCILNMQHMLMQSTVQVMSSTTKAPTSRRIRIRFVHSPALALGSLKRKLRAQLGLQPASWLQSRRLPIPCSTIISSIITAFAVHPLAPSANNQCDCVEARQAPGARPFLLDRFLALLARCV